jgi:hypothetical protein
MDFRQKPGSCNALGIVNPSKLQKPRRGRKKGTRGEASAEPRENCPCAPQAGARKRKPKSINAHKQTPPFASGWILAPSSRHWNFFSPHLGFRLRCTRDYPSSETSSWPTGFEYFCSLCMLLLRSLS